MRIEGVEQFEVFSSDFSQWGPEEDALFQRWSKIKPDPDADKYMLVNGQFVRRVSPFERIVMVSFWLLALAAIISSLVFVGSCLNTLIDSSGRPVSRSGDSWYAPPP
jgi:hypothetical protein